ncbi:MAG: hypothetical protein WCH04_20645 [Gammaproteobacteria bacterium]
MNISIHTRTTIAFLTAFGILAGCATVGKDLVRTDTVKIEKVSSAHGTVGPVSVIQERNEVTLRGEVRRRPFGPGPIPGHVELEVISPEGDVLQKCVIVYYRPSPESIYANFHAVLKVMPPGSTIRVEHDSHVVSAGEQAHCNDSL